LVDPIETFSEGKWAINDHPSIFVENTEQNQSLLYWVQAII
jgi:hypothetical protein